MDTLPQELVDRIVSFVERREGQDPGDYLQDTGLPANLPRLSVVSLSWKEAVEAITFHTLQITSTDLPNLRAIVYGARRVKVKTLAFTPILPAYSDEACGRHETVAEQIANNESFSRSLKQLFDVLKGWEDDGIEAPIKLCLMNPEYSVRRKKGFNIFKKRWEGSYIRLIELNRLPCLSRVSTLFASRLIGREYAPCTIAHIATRFPNLEAISWDLNDFDDPVPGDVDSLEDIGTPENIAELEKSGQYTSSRRERRNELAEALTTHPLRIANAGIYMYHESPNDQSRENDVLLPTDSLVDSLSSALFLLSQTLTTFHLSATIDPSLFWPVSEPDSAPTWPSLREYTVRFDITTPSGKWYFTRNPSRPYSSPGQDDDHTYNIFRDTPDSEQMEPLLLSFARAAQRMPVLGWASLTCMVTEEDYKHSQFQVSYLAPGTSVFYGYEYEDDVSSRRIYYLVRDWRPSDDLARMLREIGERYHEQEMVERFLESPCLERGY